MEIRDKFNRTSKKTHKNLAKEIVFGTNPIVDKLITLTTMQLNTKYNLTAKSNSAELDTTFLIQITVNVFLDKMQRPTAKLTIEPVVL